MALLQISEPGQSPDPHQKRLAVGIDLGTTHSLVAAVRHGVAECLPDAQGRVLLPSVVRYLGEGRRAIGHAAVEALGRDAPNTVVSAKRLMGRRLADVNDAAQLPYHFVDAPGMVRIETREGVKSPVEVAAEILATLRQRAQDTLGDELVGAVITVPAYFDDAQRQATKDAAQLAGLHVLRLLNEPTAAAVAYGLDEGVEGLYAIYDLGGGTFDVSLLRLARGVFEVIGTGGDAALGGDDLDAALVARVLSNVPRQVTSLQDRRALLVAARVCKEALSEADEAIFEAALADGVLRAEVTRADFETAIEPLLQKTVSLVRRVLRDARVTQEDVRGVVLVGGSTRVPRVRALMREVFAREPLTNLNPDEVVALGAARQAHQLAGHVGSSDVLLLDVTPLSLGLETMGGLVERIVPRNTPIPTTHAQDFTTFKDGQTAMVVHVVQGERELVTDCRSLARFELHGIPPMVAGAARIRVTFQVDADGLLEVSARETSSGVHANVVVKPSYGMGDDEIATILQDSFSSAQLDMVVRARREARVDAERLLEATRSAMAADADLLDADDRELIERLMAELDRVRRRADAEVDALTIEDATKALAQATENFAAARMNRGIRRALAGRRIDDL